MKHQKGSIDQKDALISLLLIELEGLLPDDHMIKHSACYRRLLKLYQ